MKTPIRVAVIGCGPIGNRHADLHKANPMAELVAVCDIRKDRCDASAQRLGVQGFYDAPTISCPRSRLSKRAAMFSAKSLSATRFRKRK